MTTRTPDVYYFASDKDVYDLYLGLQQKLSSAQLAKIAKRYGIICSADEPREKLAGMLAMIPASWSFVTSILEQTNTAERTERYTVTNSSVKDVSHKSLLEVVQSIKEKVEDEGGEAHHIHQYPDKEKIKVEVTYTAIDTTKAVLSQRTKKKIEFIFNLDESGNLNVRHTFGEKSDQLLKEYVGALEAKGGTVNLVPIELSGVTDSAERTRFFIIMMESIEGYSIENVKDVFVHRFNEPDDIEDEDGSEKSSAEATILVRKIALGGRNVNKSAEYKKIIEAGFFITGVVWEARPKPKVIGPRIVYEASFAQPELGSGFRCRIRGVYSMNKDGEFQTTRKRVDDPKLYKLLENAAYKAMKELQAKKAVVTNKPKVKIPIIKSKEKKSGA
jgi:hypothetical protein